MESAANLKLDDPHTKKKEEEEKRELDDGTIIDLKTCASRCLQNVEQD